MAQAGLVKAAVAVVVIGRNEGERLAAALDSALAVSDRVVYVDSGSSDASVMQAQSRAVIAHELDASSPFTAARARNCGYYAVRDNYPDTEFIQFLDGDCELDAGWMDHAIGFLNERSDVAVVCGRLRERFPDESVYNLLCDIEWNVAAGEVESCGGIFCVRYDTFAASGGFREALVAGEELEFCLRVMRSGGKIWRLEYEMALHDANMSSFFQWWKRSVRCGFTYAQGAHELGRESHRERNRALFWGAMLPLIIIAATLVFGYQGLLLLLIYPAQAARLSLRDDLKLAHSVLNSVFETLEKIPEMLGVVKFYFNRIFRVRDRLIEYK